MADSILFKGIRPKLINDYGFQARYFERNDLKNKKAIVLIGGGKWGDYWTQYFTNKKMVGPSFPYAGKEGLQ
jgi:hypothetical protein